MAITYTPNDQFPTPGPAETIPQDGDALVVASVNGALTGLLDNAAYLLRQSGYVANVFNFGATGISPGDDTAAIKLALQSGNEVVFPTGTGVGIFIISDTLAMAPRQVMVGRGLAQITMDAPSTGLPMIKFFLGNPDGPPAVVDGMNFLSFSGGPLFSNFTSTLYTSVNVVFRNCSFGNDGGGQIFSTTAASADILFEDCVFFVGNSSFTSNPVSSVMQAIPSGWRVSFVNCTFKAEQTIPGGHVMLSYAAGASGSITGCTFDYTETTSGPSFVAVLAAESVEVTGCLFDGPTGGLQGACVRWTTSFKALAVGNNTYRNFPNPFGTAPLPTLLVYSDVALPSQFVNVGSSGDPTTITVPQGFQTYDYVVKTSAPTLQLPTPLWYGQTIVVTVQNESVANWFLHVQWITGRNGATPTPGPVTSGFLDNSPASGNDMVVVTWTARAGDGALAWFMASCVPQPSNL